MASELFVKQQRKMMDMDDSQHVISRLNGAIQTSTNGPGGASERRGPTS